MLMVVPLMRVTMMTDCKLTVTIRMLSRHHAKDDDGGARDDHNDKNKKKDDDDDDADAVR